MVIVIAIGRSHVQSSDFMVTLKTQNYLFLITGCHLWKINMQH